MHTCGPSKFRALETLTTLVMKETETHVYLGIELCSHSLVGRLPHACVLVPHHRLLICFYLCSQRDVFKSSALRQMRFRLHTDREMRRHTMHCLVDAVAFLHSRHGIIHSDIRPNNVLFTASGTQHGGQESTLLSSMVVALHHGMVIVGLPGSCQDMKKVSDKV